MEINDALRFYPAGDSGLTIMSEDHRVKKLQAAHVIADEYRTVVADQLTCFRKTAKLKNQIMPGQEYFFVKRTDFEELWNFFVQRYGAKPL